jgi:hypothetical protein
VARAIAGCGLAATYAKAADSKFRACTCSAAVGTMHHVYMECHHHASARTALETAMDEWCAAMQSQDEDHRAYSRSEALTWVHSNTGAHPWCPAHGTLRQAAWVFWQETRQHKEVLGKDEDAPTRTAPHPHGPDAWPEFAARAAGNGCGPVSSCVTKATEVVQRLPWAGVALPMPFLGDHGNKQQPQRGLKKSTGFGLSST